MMFDSKKLSLIRDGDRQPHTVVIMPADKAGKFQIGSGGGGGEGVFNGHAGACAQFILVHGEQGGFQGILLTTHD